MSWCCEASVFCFAFSIHFSPEKKIFCKFFCTSMKSDAVYLRQTVLMKRSKQICLNGCASDVYCLSAQMQNSWIEKTRHLPSFDFEWFKESETVSRLVNLMKLGYEDSLSFDNKEATIIHGSVGVFYWNLWWSARHNQPLASFFEA